MKEYKGWTITLDNSGRFCGNAPSQQGLMSLSLPALKKKIDNAIPPPKFGQQVLVKNWWGDKPRAFAEGTVVGYQPLRKGHRYGVVRFFVKIGKTTDAYAARDIYPDTMGNRAALQAKYELHRESLEKAQAEEFIKPEPYTEAELLK